MERGSPSFASCLLGPGIQGAPSQDCHPQALLNPVKILALPVRYRCEPTSRQKIALAQAVGCAGVVWNDALALRRKLCQEGEKYPGSGQLQKRCITQAKRTAERSWLGAVSASMLQQSVRDPDKAFRNRWKGKFRAPRFKKRSNAQSIRICGKEFRTTDRGIRFPRIGERNCVGVALSPALQAPAPSSRTGRAGRYCAGFVVEVERKQLEPNGKAVGIDLGAASLAVASDGEKIAPPKFLRAALTRPRKLQRNLKHKQRGSHRLAKARLLVAGLHTKVSDKRLDFLHELGTRLIRENQGVSIENLHVAGMVKNRKLSKAVADAGWRTFRTLLEYKAELYGRVLHVVSRWQPTSQVRSVCGRRAGKKPLSVRAWTCPACGTEHGRDVNAAETSSPPGWRRG